MARLRKLRAVLAALALLLTVTGCSGRFDASGYTAAILDLQFQGDTKNARTLVAGATQQSLSEMYQEFISNFMASYITDGMEISDADEQKFAALAASVLGSVRYEVGEAKKTGKKEYEVPVVIQPVDTFLRYKDLLTEDALRISERVKSKKYKGTDEEVRSQVMAEIAANAYDLLERAYTDSTYDGKQTVILKIKADTSDIYSIDEDDMDNLIAKILRLDEIGG